MADEFAGETSMDTYPTYLGAGSTSAAQAQKYPSGSQGQVQRVETPMDKVRLDAERALSRTSIIRQRLIRIGERLVGPSPENGADQAKDAMGASGFIPGTTFAIDRLHQELTSLEELLAGFEQTI